jgi:hypothetical protein
VCAQIQISFPQTGRPDPALLHPHEHHVEALLQGRLDIDPRELVARRIIGQRICAAGVAIRSLLLHLLVRPAYTAEDLQQRPLLKLQYKGSIALTGLLACRIGDPPPPWRGRIQVGGGAPPPAPPSSPSPTRGEGTARPDDEVVHRRSLRGGCLYWNFSKIFNHLLTSEVISTPRVRRRR